MVVWEKALRGSSPSSSPADLGARERLDAFASSLKISRPDAFGLSQNAHFPPLFGAVCRALGIGRHDAAYLFLLNHAKAVLSAAVRASVVGPYQSQALLASDRLRLWIDASIEREKGNAAEETAVTAPVMDLWMGRHELLYSRIFNS